MSENPLLYEREYVVSSEDAIHFMGPEVIPALSTPRLILWMELVSREAASHLLQPGEDTVGVSVNIRHLAATPLNMKVRIRAKLDQQNGKVLDFSMEAFDEKDKIAEGSHQRAIVSVDKFAQRLARKAEK